MTGKGVTEKLFRNPPSINELVVIPELDTSVFVIPGKRVKNGDERLVVLNRVARSVSMSLPTVAGRYRP
jgi:hypothetical protein